MTAGGYLQEPATGEYSCAPPTVCTKIIVIKWFISFTYNIAVCDPPQRLHTSGFTAAFTCNYKNCRGKGINIVNGTCGVAETRPPVTLRRSPTPRCPPCCYKPRVSTKYTLLTGHMMPTATVQLLPQFHTFCHDLQDITGNFSTPHRDSWRIEDQLDVTCYFISLLMCSTFFGN